MQGTPEERAIRRWQGTPREQDITRASCVGPRLSWIAGAWAPVRGRPPGTGSVQKTPWFRTRFRQSKGPTARRLLRGAHLGPPWRAALSRRHRSSASPLNAMRPRTGGRIELCRYGPSIVRSTVLRRALRLVTKDYFCCAGTFFFSPRRYFGRLPWA